MAGRKSGRVGSLSIRRAAHLRWVKRLSLAEVARRAGVSRQALRDAFLRYGIPTRSSLKVTREDLETARRRGWMKQDLADHLGVTRWAIYDAQGRFGFEWPERDRG